MKEDDIRELSKYGLFRGHRLQRHFEETHISWVLFTRKYAFKIKKPVKLSFLDFSTLARRKKFCELELNLNRRFSKIYLGVVPVRYYEDSWHLGTGAGKLIDCAVQMKRMISGKRMDKLLSAGKVKEKNILSLAAAIAAFHSQSEIVRTRFDLRRARDVFNDIQSSSAFIKERLGADYASMIGRSVKWSDAFLKSHARRIQDRIDLGFRRDVHGDLHSGNIFLYAKPVLFDCIEFSDSIRQIDVLHEIAFFCMDLEAFGRRRLVNIFLKEYNTLFPSILTKEDERLLTYYKCCRANVRAKIHASIAEQSDDHGERDQHIMAARSYLNLMTGYMNR